MKNLSIAALCFTMSFMLFGCGYSKKEKQLKKFISVHVEKVEPITTQANLTYWDASTTGKPEDYDKLSKLQLKISRIYNNSKEYAFIKGIKESGQVKEARLARQLDKLYYAYLQNQIEPELLEKLVDSDTKVQEKYNTFRGDIDGKKVTMSDIYTIMTTEIDCRKRELAWRASRPSMKGPSLDADLLDNIKLIFPGQKHRQVPFRRFSDSPVATHRHTKTLKPWQP